jgi:general secretion pathway protein A
MYTQFFNLKQSPFSIAPDPRYLFMSERHREALAHLLYGVGSGGGFVLLTGEIGAGKTTVCRCFMEQIPANCRLAYIFNPKLTVEELLQSICDEFRVAMEPPATGAASAKNYVDAINRYLLASHAHGFNNVLVIDEAQNLSADVLEQLRLLTNLETSERKLLQIILIGQPELRGMLAKPELEQLAQRVIARYHLGSLSPAEVSSYVEHRLAVAGATAIAPFPRTLMPLLHQLTKGVPRRINLLCDRALLGAYVENQQQVNRTILRKAAEEVFAGEAKPATARRPWQFAAGLVAGLALSGAAAWQLMPAAARHDDAKVPAVAAASKPQAAPKAAPVTQAAATPVAAVAAMPAASTPEALAAAQAAAAVAAVNVESAVRQLAVLWDVELADGESCPEAAKRGLRCLVTKGGLAEIASLDRPVIIKLRDDPAHPVYALVLALDDGQATLWVDGKKQMASLATLDSRFDGSFITFWRAPKAWRDEISAGDRGPDVDWLARNLAQLNGAKKPRERQPLDAVTLRYLRDFQLSQNLKADGVAGPKTFIRLNQLGGVAEPRLRTQAKIAAVAGK